VIHITIERDGVEEVFQYVTDYCVTVRQLVPDAVKAAEVRSVSHNGGALREIVKEVREVLVELEEHAALARERQRRADS